ncbi:MAG: phytoene synthase [Acidimicrobiia bacterium]|nr:phytoene synthase [Acidimicrobiia bacterium]
MTALEESYRRCRSINKAHGTTYYWSAQLLGTPRRQHVHALYAFCRVADDVVDDLGPAPVAQRAAALQAFGDRFFSDLLTGHSTHPVLAAVVDTARRYSIPTSAFERFLASMAMDFSVSTYESFADLCRYMDGSAAVIGEMMLPLLEPSSPAAFQAARDLGIAFQLTNFLRDVAEDLDRGRVYLPQEDLRRFNADPSARLVTDAWRDFMAFEIERTRAFYESADEGIDFLGPVPARCIATARQLYSQILVEIERADYDVFSRRLSVPTSSKVASVALARWRRPSKGSVAAVARRRSSPGTIGLRNP